ncbi:MAG: C-terminal helicase domain-containing protein [Roseburia sp.]
MDACVELVRQAVDGGHKVLLFSQFTSVLDEIEKALAKEKIEDHRIDGSVSKEQRIRLVDSFETDDVPVFCISLKAGGTGLNLTAAEYRDPLRSMVECCCAESGNRPCAPDRSEEHGDGL